jgi:hypothetical protein
MAVLSISSEHYLLPEASEAFIYAHRVSYKTVIGISFHGFLSNRSYTAFVYAYTT